MRHSLISFSLTGCLLVTGCYNTIYQYEADKIALAIQAKQDPSQPISGTLGLKQRAVVIVPSEDEGGFGSFPEADASPMITLYDFQINSTDNQMGLPTFSSYGITMTGRAAMGTVGTPTSTDNATAPQTDTPASAGNTPAPTDNTAIPTATIPEPIMAQPPFKTPEATFKTLMDASGYGQ